MFGQTGGGGAGGGFGTQQRSLFSTTPSQAIMINPNNKREQKEFQKDTFQQARLFKQLQEESQQLNQILIRGSSTTQGGPSKAGDA